MSPETIQAVTNLIEALTRFAQALGSGWFVAVTLAIVSAWIFLAMYREKRRDDRTMRIVNAKEQEIERLAEDNRRYREVYLAKLGAPEELLRLDRLDSEKAKAERAND